MSKVKIVYGTCGGNTEIVCQKVADVLGEQGHEVELLQSKLTEASELGEYDLLVLACPTYGKGELELYFAKFMAKLAEVDLKDRPCTIIGLGHPKYEPDYHLESAKIILDFLKEKEAKLVHMPLRISKNPMALWDFIERWALKISESI